jgi:hypothetical protein
MDQKIVLDLDDGRQLAFNVTEVASFESRHTGRSLKRITAEVAVIGAEQHEELAAIMETHRDAGLASVPPGIEQGKRWRARGTSHRYSPMPGQRTTYEETVELDEHESLLPTKLLIGDASFQPYEYREEVDSDGLLQIHAAVQLPPEGARALRRMSYGTQLYYTVVREGVSDQARQMSFGQTMWSKHDAGEKYKFALHEQPPVTHKFVALYPEVHRLVAAAATDGAVIAGLQKLLVTKGIATQEEVEAIHQAARDGQADGISRFYQCMDVGLLDG